MLKIATILLGLSIGVHPIELIVEEPVVQVRVLLDDREIAVLDSPPWKFDCDFGQELRPHELSVIGFDAEGEVVASERVGINLPRRLADDVDGAQLHLLRESGSKHPNAVRIEWNSLQDTRITQFEMSLNGAAIETDSLNRTPLPEYDPTQFQLLEVRLTFGNDKELRLERAFGGGIPPEQAATALTSVPISLRDKKNEPDVSDLDSHFMVGARPLNVRSFETGKAEIYIVVAPGTTPLPSGGATGVSGQGKRPKNNPLIHKLVIPFPNRTGKGILYPIIDLQIPDGHVGRRIAYGDVKYVTRGVARFADAVAVAGRLAAGSGNRRAVVVLVGPEHEDSSAYSIGTVRGYLEELHVPLYVWSTWRGATAWGPATHVDTAATMNRSLRSVWRDLKSQRIVWLDGAVPIHRVEIGESDLFRSVFAEPGLSDKKKRSKKKGRR